MNFDNLAATSGLAQRVESNVRQTAYGRIRNLVVEVIHGRVVVSGQGLHGTSNSLHFRGHWSCYRANALPKESPSGDGRMRTEKGAFPAIRYCTVGVVSSAGSAEPS